MSDEVCKLGILIISGVSVGTLLIYATFKNSFTHAHTRTQFIYIVSLSSYHEHDVEEDVPECVDDFEEKCEQLTQGYTTEEKCTKWPLRRCNLVKQQTKKYSPVTECKKVPFELCGPAGCPVEPGAEECQERVQTVRGRDCTYTYLKT